MSDLEAVAGAAADSEAAATRLRRVIAAARQEGASVTDLAASARVTRQTVYRWLAMEGQGAGSGSPKAALRESVTMLMPHLEPHHQQQVQVRIESGKDEQMLTAVKMLRSWLPVSFASEATDEERAALGMISEAADRLQQQL